MSSNKVRIYLSEEIVDAELADSFFARFKGLSFRADGKMLFSFPKETRAFIDMMFLSEPLYLYFIDSNKEIIEIQKAEPWSWNPRTWKLYRPEKTYRYLLESFEQLNVSEGDSLEFEV